MHHDDYNLHVNKQWRGPLPDEKITGREVWSAVPAIRWLLIAVLIAITVKLIW